MNDRGTPPSRIAGLLVGGVLLPGVCAGVLIAEALRRRRLNASWSACACLPSLILAAWVAPGTTTELARIVDSPASARAVVSILWPWWVVAIAPSALWWQLRRDRRDRLRGGRAEAELRRRRGPLDVLRAHQQRRTASSPTDVDGQHILLGQNERGRPFVVSPLRAHATIVGGSGSGKTNTAVVLLEGHVAGGAGFVALDGKGGRDLPRAALELGRRYQRPVALWSIHPFGEPDLDAHRVTWNPTGGSDATEIKDRIAAAEEQTEPYYAAIAARGLQTAAAVLLQTRTVVSLDELASLLESDRALLATLRGVDEQRYGAEIAWLSSLNDGERSALRGIGLRLTTMVASTGGAMLLPSADGRDLDVLAALREGWLVVFTLPQGTYPKLVPQTARYVLSTLNAACTQLETAGTPADAVIFVDELSAFDGDELVAAYERARSAGVSVMVATQSLSNFAAAGGDKLLHAALDNSELIVVHRQAVPDAAELLAGVAGTEEAWEHTHKVIDAGSGSSRLGSALGADEPGERNRRLTDRFRAHPNQIKELGVGEAVVIAQRPAPMVQRIAVRLATTSAKGKRGDR